MWSFTFLLAIFYYSGCTTNALRLQGGANNLTGRLEFCSGGMWGTVCDDLFGNIDANVACRQLGFSSTGELVGASPYKGSY